MDPVPDLDPGLSQLRRLHGWAGSWVDDLRPGISICSSAKASEDELATFRISHAGPRRVDTSICSPAVAPRSEEGSTTSRISHAGPRQADTLTLSLAVDSASEDALATFRFSHADR